jgi:NAD(P)H-nitrite reductase large subunit
MGRAAGCAAVGVERPTAGVLRLNAARFFDVPLIALGEVAAQSPEAERIVLTRSPAVYRMIVRRAGRVVGAVLYGDIAGAGVLYRLYRDAVDIETVPRARLTERYAVGELSALLTS